MEKQLGAEAAGAGGAVLAIASFPEQRAADAFTERVGAAVKMFTVVEGEANAPQEHADLTGWILLKNQGGDRGTWVIRFNGGWDGIMMVIAGGSCQATSSSSNIFNILPAGR